MPTETLTGVVETVGVQGSAPNLYPDPWDKFLQKVTFTVPDHSADAAGTYHFLQWRAKLRALLTATTYGLRFAPPGFLILVYGDLFIIGGLRSWRWNPSLGEGSQFPVSVPGTATQQDFSDGTYLRSVENGVYAGVFTYPVLTTAPIFGFGQTDPPYRDIFTFTARGGGGSVELSWRVPGVGQLLFSVLSEFEMVATWNPNGPGGGDPDPPPGQKPGRFLVADVFRNICVAAAESTVVSGGKRNVSIWINRAVQVPGSVWESYGFVDVDDATEIGLAFLPNGVLYLSYTRNGVETYQLNTKFGAADGWGAALTTTEASQILNAGRAQKQTWKVWTA